MIDIAYLMNLCGQYELPLTQEQAEKLDVYAGLLVEWNQKMNLTAITEPKAIVEKHFLDSLLLLKAAELPENTSLIDVGTGAGFPSVPVGILRGDLNLTLLDSLNKRLMFLEAVCSQVGVKARRVHARAEEAARKPEFREQYEVATARAVANLPVLCEYCLPYVKVGGRFIALKGAEAEQETQAAKKAISLLGARLQEVKAFTLPDGGRRGIVVIEKISQTPTKYPRPSGTIAKSPLV